LRRGYVRTERFKEKRSALWVAVSALDTDEGPATTMAAATAVANAKLSGFSNPFQGIMAAMNRLAHATRVRRGRKRRRERQRTQVAHDGDKQQEPGNPVTRGCGEPLHSIQCRTP